MRDSTRNRVLKRIDVDVGVDVNVDEAKSWIKGHMVNVSLSGSCLIIDKENQIDCDKGDTIQLRVTVEDKDEEFVAKIVWAAKLDTGMKIGIKFENSSLSVGAFKYLSGVEA